MPLLSKETSIRPENLLEEDYVPATDSGRIWLVAHTLPRQEKSLCRSLEKGGDVQFYLPLIHRRWKSRGRTVQSHLPLFPSYVFLYASVEERLKAIATNRVVRTLEPPDQEGIWRDLRQIYALISTGAPITREERLEPGRRVVIKSGPLAGLAGTVMRSASGRKFVVIVDFLQQGASVLIDHFELEALDI